MIVERGLIPFVDIAYQGFGRGLNDDAHGLRGILAACDEVIAAQSCDKNFSVYRDRVGSLWVKTRSLVRPLRAMTHVHQGARKCGPCRPIMALPQSTSFSTITSSGGMAHRARRDADRINAVRERIAAADPRLAFIGGIRHVLDAPCARNRWSGLRERPCEGASTSSAKGPRQFGRFIAPVVERAGRLADHGRSRPGPGTGEDPDWREVARLVLTSREMDAIEEPKLVPGKKIFYQFSARGHDLAQVCWACISRTEGRHLRLLPFAPYSAFARCRA